MNLDDILVLTSFQFHNDDIANQFAQLLANAVIGTSLVETKMKIHQSE